MILKRLILPGRFVQAHPYFDTLWLVRMDGTVMAFDTEAYASRVLNGSGGAAAKAFARNDRLVVERGRVRLQDQTTDVRKFLEGGTDLQVSQEHVDEFSFTFPRERLLEETIDLRFYSGRAYAATDHGLIVFRALGRNDLELGSPRRGDQKALELDRWTDAMPIQIQARLGTVNASCGEDGGLYWTGASSAATNLRPKQERFADLSFATEFSGAGVANIEGPVKISALPASKILVEKRFDGARGEVPDRQEIVGIDPRGDADARERFDQTIRRGARPDGRPAQAFVTTKRAFVHYSDGWMANFPIATGDDFAHGAASLKRHPGPGGRILSMTTTAGQVVAECRDDVRIFRNDEWVRIFEGAVFSVRGYPQSRWYRNLITVVGEDHVELILLIET